MPRRTSTLLAPDGAPVVHHSADPGPDADAIRHEATVLALARSPGVVDLVATGDEEDGGAWLSTRYVAGGTLTDLLRSAGEPAATAALARVAGTLADLHDRGIVHGRCTADHVVGGATGASLCGFSAAAVAESGRPDVRADEQALATLVTTTLTSDAESSRRARRTVAALTAPSSGTNLRAVAAELWALARDAGWVEPARALGESPPRHGDRGGAEPTTRGPVARRRSRSRRVVGATPRIVDAPSPPEQPGGPGGAEPTTRRPSARRRLRSRRPVDATLRSVDTPSTPGQPLSDPGPEARDLRPRRSADVAAAADRPAGRARTFVFGKGRAGPEPDERGTEPAVAPVPGGGTDGAPSVAGPGDEAVSDGAPPARRPVRNPNLPITGEVTGAGAGSLASGGRHRLQDRLVRGGVVGGRHAAAVRVVRRRGRLAVTGAAAAASMAVLAGILLLGDGGPNRPQAAPAAPSDPPVQDPPPGASAPVPPPPPDERPRAPARIWPRPTQAGPAPPPEPVPPTAGASPAAATPVVAHGGARYAIGLPGDLVVLGDWDCDGTTTPAVVRPADGSVWAFPGWTEGPEVLVAEPVGHAPAPLGVSARSDGAGCDVLAITTADGDEVLVHPQAEASG